MKVNAQSRLLDILFSTGDPYQDQGNRGLLGVFNDNPNDDLTLPNGTIIDSSLASDIQYIHENFGEACKFLSCSS